jgi:hypothetical protein
VAPTLGRQVFNMKSIGKHSWVSTPWYLSSGLIVTIAQVDACDKCTSKDGSRRT